MRILKIYYSKYCFQLDENKKLLILDIINFQYFIQKKIFQFSIDNKILDSKTKNQLVYKIIKDK